MKSQPFLVSEELLLRKLNKRDETAFQWLYDQYAHVLYGVVLTGVGQPDEATQIVEEIFVKAWSEFDQFKPEKTRLLTWLLNRARAEVANYLAKMPAQIPEQFIDYEQTANLISNEKRSLVEAVYFRGQSVAQLSEAGQQSETNLHHQLRAVLQELKSIFSQ